MCRCAITSLAGCATPQPAQFDSVAQSGAKFAGSVPPLLTTALDEAIAANSATLVMERLSRAGEDLRRRRQPCAAPQGLLRRNGALTNTGGDGAVGSEAENLVNAMGTLSPRIASFEIGGRSVGSIAASVAPLVVADFQGAALEEELRRNGDAVVRAIELQRAFLQAIAGDLGSQLAAQQQEQEFTSVIEPYLSNDALPSDWVTLRAAALQQRMSSSTASRSRSMPMRHSSRMPSPA